MPSGYYYSTGPTPIESIREPRPKAPTAKPSIRPKPEDEFDLEYQLLFDFLTRRIERGQPINVFDADKLIKRGFELPEDYILRGDQYVKIGSSRDTARTGTMTPGGGTIFGGASASGAITGQQATALLGKPQEMGLTPEQIGLVESTRARIASKQAEQAPAVPFMPAFGTGPRKVQVDETARKERFQRKYDKWAEKNPGQAARIEEDARSLNFRMFEFQTKQEERQFIRQKTQELEEALKSDAYSYEVKTQIKDLLTRVTREGVDPIAMLELAQSIATNRTKEKEAEQQEFDRRQKVQTQESIIRMEEGYKIWEKKYGITQNDRRKWTDEARNFQIMMNNARVMESRGRASQSEIDGVESKVRSLDADLAKWEAILEEIPPAPGLDENGKEQPDPFKKDREELQRYITGLGAAIESMNSALAAVSGQQVSTTGGGILPEYSPQPPPSQPQYAPPVQEESYGSPDEVKAAWQNGKISRGKAVQILIDQFGMEP